MAKKESVIETIQKKLQKHLEDMEALFPMEMQLTIVGRDVDGMGCEFVIGADDPEEVIGVIERTIERQEEEEKALKKQAKKKIKKKK